MSSFNRLYHREMAEKALKSIDSVPPQQRELCGITVAPSEEDFAAVRTKTQEFIIGLNARYGDAEKPKAVYQINVQGFPLVKLPSDA